MRVAFVGKGGSGKTTASSLFIRLLLKRGLPVLAIDADINQHLAESLDLPVDAIESTPELGNAMPALKTALRGRNARIPSNGAMVKTTPPGPGSHLIALSPNDPVLGHFAYQKDGLSLLRVGGFEEEDLGTKCYHAKTGAVELVLNHLLDLPDDWVVTDMTAGADAFASGLFTRFDLTVLVVEPTRKSLGVWHQYRDYAKHYGVVIGVLGNKVEDEADAAFLKEACGDHLIGWLSQSRWVRESERGMSLPFAALEADNRTALGAVCEAAQSHPRDWTRYWHWATHFHEKNAVSWANDAAGCDVTQQIDHAFLQSFASLYDKAGNDHVTEKKVRFGS